MATFKVTPEHINKARKIFVKVIFDKNASPAWIKASRREILMTLECFAPDMWGDLDHNFFLWISSDYQENMA